MVSDLSIPSTDRGIHILFPNRSEANRANKYLGKIGNYDQGDSLDGFISQSQKEFFTDVGIDYVELDRLGNEVSKEQKQVQEQ